MEPWSHAVGPLGDFWFGQPGVPSAGKGSAPTGPWWWQWGREKSLHVDSPANGSCRGEEG